MYQQASERRQGRGKEGKRGESDRKRLTEKGKGGEKVKNKAERDTG